MNPYKKRQEWECCLYLRKNEHIIQEQDHRLIHKPKSYFVHSSMDALELWKDNVCMSIDLLPAKSNQHIRRFFLRTGPPSPTTNRALDHANLRRIKQNKE